MKLAVQMQTNTITKFTFRLQSYSDIEKKIFHKQTLMATVFNCIDLSFQLCSASSDEAFAIACRHMHDFCKYYDRKYSIFVHQNKQTVDIFWFCIRKDKPLSKYLEKEFAGFDEFSANTMNIGPVENNAPQPTIMEMESASKWIGFAADNY